MKPMDHISYSFLHLMVCPYAAFLRYEAAIRGGSSPWLALGNGLHTTLESAHKEQNFDLRSWVDLFKSEYNRIINEEEVFVSYPQLKKLETEGITMLEVYHGQIELGQITKHPLDVEKDFRIPVAGTFLVGRIDKVELDSDGEFAIIDYKSGKSKPDPWSLRNNLQLTAYYWAGFEIYGRYPSKLIWHHLRTGEQLVSERTLEDVENLKVMINNAVQMREQGIRHRVFHDSICGDGSGRGVSCDFRGAVCSDKELEIRTVAKLVNA
jgi:RecB family exonuclease